MFAHFKIWLFIFYYSGTRSSLYILNVNHLLDIRFAIFFPPLGFFVCLKAEKFNFDEV